MGFSSTQRAGWARRGLLSCAVAAAFFLGGAADALAAAGYTLDPVLSLTGNCATTKADTVPDPGCPGGKHPPQAFKTTLSTATDSYGNIFVANYGNEAANGAEGRIDIFNSAGFYIGEVTDSFGPKDLALDGEGNLYVFDANPKAGGRLVRFSPTGTYKPEKGEIEYAEPPTVVKAAEALFLQSIAVNPLNGHVFLNWGHFIEEFGNAAEGNKSLAKFGEGLLEKSNGQGLAVDAAHGLVYADDTESIRVFELASPHKLIRTVDGSAVPVKFTTFASLTADEANGHFFVFDGTSKKRVYEFLEDGTYVGTLQGSFPPIFGSELSVDNGPFSPHSGFKSSAKAGYLFLASEESSLSQSLAFAPPTEFSPEVEAVSFANVSQEDAELRATINPGGLKTEYVFEYTTQQRFEEEGFAGATVAGKGEIPAGLVGAPALASASGLVPETAYRFRVVATNGKGTDEKEDAFTTYPEEEATLPCPNDATRTGFSALLPDCRAYELVTPPDTNARTPRGIGKSGSGIYFTTREASPAGNKVTFITEGGTLPGDEGTGSLAGDAYLSTRGPSGWSTASAGPNGVESVSPQSGSTSPDQGYSFWKSSSEGSAAVEGEPTSYLRYPDGHSALIGRGSLAVDPQAEGELISENGAHVIFATVTADGHVPVQLEENAPPTGTAAVYDRTIDQETGEEETHVVSLLPGNVTPEAGQNALYEGASLDGRGVAFEIGEKLYLRFNDEETYEIGEHVTFEGVAEGGARIFYLEGGNLFAFDAESDQTIQFTESGDVTPVNVSADGTATYFISPSVLTGAEENPNGATAQPGEENLYLSREGTISFVATVTERDVKGVFGETEQTDGLGLWTSAANLFGATSGRFAIDPSRTTPDGSVMLFESRAPLAGYNSDGYAEIYRYDSIGNELECLSCNPTGAPATSDASLQSILQEFGGPQPFNSFALVNNLRADGRRAFFQSSEPLVQNDTDGLQDVYEWEADGVGTCERPQGCIYLISSGQSKRTDYLYAVSDSGSDVFFRTSDLLLRLDTDETPSIYDARVGGGFPEPAEEPCEGEGCRPSLTPAPGLPTPGMLPEPASGNSNPPLHCPKGKRKVIKNGKARCVKKKQHKRRHHRAGSQRKGVGK